jgi:hypothetical protein
MCRCCVRHPQSIVQEGGKKRQAQTYGCFRQSLSHRSRYFLPTRRAVIFVGDMCRCRRTDGRNVLHNPGMLATRCPQRIVTIRTFGQFVLYCLIDVDWSGSPYAGMSILATWFAVSFPSRQLAVDRVHGRRRRLQSRSPEIGSIQFTLVRVGTRCGKPPNTRLSRQRQQTGCKDSSQLLHGLQEH